MARLEKLDMWTEEPAKDVAKALSDPPAAEKPATEGEPSPTPATTPVAAPAPRKTPGKGGKSGSNGAKPWLMGEELAPGAAKAFQVRLPAELFLQLKWLGETTYGSSMNSICIEAIRHEVHKLVRERMKE